MMRAGNRNARPMTRWKGLDMEIIARLREEREALVARVAQIDKMLKQYEDWGREAQRLISLTGLPEAEAVASPAADDKPEPLPQSEGVDDHVLPVSRARGTIRRANWEHKTLIKTPIAAFEEAVIDVLRDARRPMDRVALYDALTARGIVIGEGDRDKELNALSARVYRMSRDPKNRISSARGQGYRLMSDEEVAFLDSIEVNLD